MSIDWGDIEPEGGVATKAKIDWEGIEPEAAPKRKRGQWDARRFSPPKGEASLEVLGKTAEEKPEFLASQLPPAVLEVIGRKISPKGVADMVSRLFGKDWGTEEFQPRTASKPPEFGDWRDKLPVQEGKSLFDTLGEKYREGLPEDQREMAKRTAEAEADILQFLPWGVLGKKLPLKGPQALAEAETWGPKGIKGPSSPTAIQQMLEGRPDKVPATMESGLPKLRALEAKRPQMGTITPARQEQLVTGLNKEAAALATKRVGEAHPLIEDINAGKNLDAEFSKGFSGIKAAAEKYNPDIDIAPLTKLYGETTRQYRGIPELHSQAKKVMREIDSFRKNPQSGMGNLLRIYRSNNQKKKDIYDKRFLTGKQAEFVDFLDATNRAISESFQNTLPKDSPWLKQFLDYNDKYGDYMDTLKTQSMMRPIIGGDLTPENIGKFIKIGFDPKKQAKLRYSMGKEGADKIIQLARDLRAATEAIKKIPAKEWKMWEKALPVGIGIPFVGKLAGAKALYDYARRGYGYYLTKPEKIEAFDGSLKAIIENNPGDFKEATEKLVPKPSSLLIKEEGTSQIGERVSQYNPDIKESRFRLPEETPVFWSGRSFQKSNINPKNEAETKIRKKEWDNLLPKDQYSKYYSGKRDLPIIEETTDWGSKEQRHKRLSQSEDLRKYMNEYDDQRDLGTLRDWIKEPALKDALKEVLDTPVMKLNPVMADMLSSDKGVKGGGHYNHVNRHIRVSPYLEPADLFQTLVHEGGHALDHLMPAPPGSNAKSLLDHHLGDVSTEELYIKNPNEISARAFALKMAKAINDYKKRIHKARKAFKYAEFNTLTPEKLDMGERVRQNAISKGASEKQASSAASRAMRMAEVPAELVKPRQYTKGGLAKLLE